MKVKNLRAIIAKMDGELDVCVIGRDGSAYALLDTHQIAPVDDEGMVGEDAKDGWGDALVLEVD